MARASPLDSGKAEANGECTWRVRHGPDDKHPEPPQQSVADLAGGQRSSFTQVGPIGTETFDGRQLQWGLGVALADVAAPHLVESGRAEAGQ